MPHATITDNWIAYNEDLEGVVFSAYADVLSLITTAMGFLADPMPSAMGLPWRRPTKLVRVPGQSSLAADDSCPPATQAEIASEWMRVKGGCCGIRSHITRASCPRVQAGAVCFAHDGWTKSETPGALRLTKTAADGLSLAKLRSNHGVLKTYFKDIDAWPLSSQMAAHSLAWAVGPHWPTKFPKCKAACLRQDWLVAAKECEIKPAHGTVVTRNARQKLLFENAAAGAPGIDWKQPYRPAHVLVFPTKD